jgi:hypothetical protein
MTAAAGFNILYALYLEWVAIPVDVEKVDDLLDGWDPDAEDEFLRTVEGKLRAVVA